MLSNVIEAFFKNKRLLNKFNFTSIVHERIICTKNSYYALFECYIKYKSEKRLYIAPAAEGTLWNFIPVGRFGYYLARRVCCVFTKALHFATTEGKREREPASAIDIWSTPALPGENIAICIFRKRLHALRIHPHQFASFCLHAVPFIRGCLPFDLIISFV